MKIETKRLILRKPTLKDVKDIVENLNDLRVSKNLFVVAYPYTLKDAKDWVKYCNKKTKESYNFNIELKSEKKIVGGVGLSHVEENNGTAEIGYWLGVKYQRQGIMSEAAKKLIDFAFNKLKLRRLEASIFKENKPSQCLAKSLGFKYEGTKREDVKSKATGKIHDGVIYGLLKKDWKIKNDTRKS